MEINGGLLQIAIMLKNRMSREERVLRRIYRRIQKERSQYAQNHPYLRGQRMGLTFGMGVVREELRNLLEK